MSDYTNVFTNVITPFDPRRTKLLLGSLEYIAAEVIVAKVARKIIRADNKGWFELAYIHALSLPFMGGTAAFFEQKSPYVGQEWNNDGWRAKNFERSEKYRNAYWDVIPKGGQEPSNLWIENLSTLVATTPYTQNFRQVTKNPRVFHNLYNINPDEHSRAAYEICQNVLFYSDAGKAKGHITSMINVFMVRIKSDDTIPNFSYVHRQFELDKYEYSPDVTMESVNYNQIRDLIGEHDPRETYESEVLEESEVLVADIVTGEYQGEDIDPDVSKATVAKVLTVEGEEEKPVVKKTKLDVIAEQDDETSTITYLVIAGAIFAFAFR